MTPNRSVGLGSKPSQSVFSPICKNLPIECLPCNCKAGILVLWHIEALFATLTLVFQPVHVMSNSPSILRKATPRDLCEFTPSDLQEGGWSITFEVDTRGVKDAETLFSLEGVVSVAFRMAGTDSARYELDHRFGNYLRYPLSDGLIPVLECTLPGGTPIGVPLAALKEPEGIHQVMIRRGNDAAWSLSVDGVVMDADGLLDRTIPWPEAMPEIDIASSRVDSFSFLVPALDLPQETDERPVDRPIQFWTPDGFNTWVGDVVVGIFRNRFHLFYLFDRRHHGSKKGTGGHYFAHLSSADLVHWVEHPVATTIPEWWMTCGTGTPFVWKDRFYLAYGLHTTRFMPSEETCEKAMHDAFQERGEMGEFAFGELPGYPIGGTCAVSDDGIHFSPTHQLIHPAQNPTIYNRTDGLLGLVNSYGGLHGMFVSDRPSGWKMLDPDIPIDGDCPCEFEWKGHHYLIQGFQYMAYNEDGRVGGWVDWSQTGDDIYDGLSVPMVASWGEDRRIMAGWIQHPAGWGGWLAFHELVAFPDGKLGVKWLDETPPPGDVYSFECKAGETVRIVIPNEGKGPSVEFRIEAKEARAQWADVEDASIPAPRQMTQAEWNASTDPEVQKKRYLRACEVAQYAVQNLRGLEKPFRVRVAVSFDAKSGCTLLDAEIAGSRAMICQRTGRFGAPIRFTP